MGVDINQRYQGNTCIKGISTAHNLRDTSFALTMLMPSLSLFFQPSSEADLDSKDFACEAKSSPREGEKPIPFHQ